MVQIFRSVREAEVHHIAKILCPEQVYFRLRSCAGSKCSRSGTIIDALTVGSCISLTLDVVSVTSGKSVGLLTITSLSL